MPTTSPICPIRNKSIPQDVVDRARAVLRAVQKASSFRAVPGDASTNPGYVAFKLGFRHRLVCLTDLTRADDSAQVFRVADVIPLEIFSLSDWTKARKHYTRVQPSFASGTNNPNEAARLLAEWLSDPTPEVKFEKVVSEPSVAPQAAEPAPADIDSLMALTDYIALVEQPRDMVLAAAEQGQITEGPRVKRGLLGGAPGPRVRTVVMDEKATLYADRAHVPKPQVVEVKLRDGDPNVKSHDIDIHFSVMSKLSPSVNVLRLLEAMCGGAAGVARSTLKDETGMTESISAVAEKTISRNGVQSLSRQQRQVLQDAAGLMARAIAVRPLEGFVDFVRVMRVEMEKLGADEPFVNRISPKGIGEIKFTSSVEGVFLAALLMMDVQAQPRTIRRAFDRVWSEILPTIRFEVNRPEFEMLADGLLDVLALYETAKAADDAMPQAPAEPETAEQLIQNAANAEMKAAEQMRNLAELRRQIDEAKTGSDKALEMKQAEEEVAQLERDKNNAQHAVVLHSKGVQAADHTIEKFRAPMEQAQEDLRRIQNEIAKLQRLLDRARTERTAAFESKQNSEEEIARVATRLEAARLKRAQIKPVDTSEMERDHAALLEEANALRAEAEAMRNRAFDLF